MMCQQCGAPMLLNRERDYYFCQYCGAYHFPQQTAEGVRILGEDPKRIQCPLCKIAFNLVTLDNHYRGYQCPNCQGMLFNRGTFLRTIETRRARATTPPDPPTRHHEEELHRRVNCPKCSRRMENHLYLGPGNIVIDTCGDCNLIWLDYGELEKVINAPGKDRGPKKFKPADFPWDKPSEYSEKKDTKNRGNLEIDLLDLLDDLFS